MREAAGAVAGVEVVAVVEGAADVPRWEASAAAVADRWEAAADRRRTRRLRTRRQSTFDGTGQRAPERSFTTVRRWI